jgi:dihydroxyacetone kinase-like protein
LDSLNEKDVRAIIRNLRELMEEKKSLLIELDSALGDGDLGISMTAGFKKADEDLAGFEEKHVNKILVRAGMAVAKGGPSTLGTLIATGFMRAGKAIEDKTEINLTYLAKMMNAFVQGIMERGKSKPGEKTIIDSLHPAAQALEKAANDNKSLEEALSLAFEAAVRGVEETKKMRGQHGRAAYYQEKSLDKQDPGATVGMFLVKAFADYASRAK